ncbi:hypothetical protein GCK72_025432 [Caenorhabditis remanei]|uniref:Uncharacterized protein n=1 Tax=Caenorhabditis remanei TaxID=31234 RepID=A0A6A5G2P2_CAERE|nr:hypothetical protein GCK72_025432 [Caenorhabditis remanei]KAF1748965.1 hypothetical protein GCK72_025432 [Caenorhabditis remanei]
MQVRTIPPYMNTNILMGFSSKEVRGLISISVKKGKESKPATDLRVDLLHRNFLKTLVQSLHASKQARSSEVRRNKRSNKEEVDNRPAKKVAKRRLNDVVDDHVVKPMNSVPSDLDNSQTRASQ